MQLYRLGFSGYFLADFGAQLVLLIALTSLYAMLKWLVRRLKASEPEESKSSEQETQGIIVDNSQLSI